MWTWRRSTAAWEAIRSALHEHGVLAFPAQELTREEQVAFTAQLGAVHGHPVPEYLFGAADPVSVVENDGEKLPQDDQHFHVDSSFSREIPDLAVLHAEVVPPVGGDTMWSNAAAAHDALSPAMRDFLARDRARTRWVIASGSSCAARSARRRPIAPACSSRATATRCCAHTP